MSSPGPDRHKAPRLSKDWLSLTAKLTSEDVESEVVRIHQGRGIRIGRLTSA